ncbi:MAG: hypothetical protein ONB44_07530 [candidate division KSB1 bacterium]|nr:hypothetical protein [candidate division KSB1 bacterium]MDZ7301977.1 hypothetical protein [candidate division KSB1 bacterium]MDZ7312382.1 hypothetical protein [candidate division KSB1 bacterium]
MSGKTIGLVTLALISCIAAKMTLAQPLTLQQVVEVSGVIFSGTVTKVWSERDVATGFIVTHAQIAVQEAVRGTNGNQFTFKQYGGRSGGLNVFVADMSYFVEGEEVVAFLYPASALGLTSPVGTNEGKMTVRRDPETGKKMVYGSFVHAQMLAPFIGKSAPAPEPAVMPVPIMEYDRFIGLVRQLAQCNPRQ